MCLLLISASSARAGTSAIYENVEVGKWFNLVHLVLHLTFLQPFPVTAVSGTTSLWNKL